MQRALDKMLVLFCTFGVSPSYYPMIVENLGEYDYDEVFTDSLKEKYPFGCEFSLRRDTSYALYLLNEKDTACFAFDGSYKLGFGESFSSNVIDEHEIYLFKYGGQKAMDSYLVALDTVPTDDGYG